MPIALLLPIVVAGLALVGAAIADVWRLQIPDRFAVMIVAAFAVAAIGRPAIETGFGVLTGVAVFGAGAALFARGWLGGGDVKLLAAAATWAGPAGLPWLLQVTAGAGAALASVMLLLLSRRIPDKAVAPLAAPMPFGVAIAAGGLAVLAGRLPAF